MDVEIADVATITASGSSAFYAYVAAMAVMH